MGLLAFLLSISRYRPTLAAAPKRLAPRPEYHPLAFFGMAEYRTRQPGISDYRPGLRRGREAGRIAIQPPNLDDLVRAVIHCPSPME
jgi:hypothetical protein